MGKRRSPIRVALFRPRDDAEGSGARLRKLGFRVASLPVVTIVTAHVQATRKRYDAVVASSAWAFAGGASEMAASPLYVVGARTARAAEASGWRLAAPPAPDAARLAETLKRTLSPGAAVLYLAGRDRKPSLEAALSGLCALEVVEAYSAEPRASWSPTEIRALASSAVALHYSGRSAALAARLADLSGVRNRFVALRHVCLSNDVAEPLRAIGAACIVVAERPDEAALFAALNNASAVFPSDGRSRI
jgi:uroporphyrinogen-III synthase